MKKITTKKKFIAMFLSLAMLLTPISAFAAEPNNSAPSPYAVSGWGQGAGAQDQFYIYSPGSSTFAHIKVTIVNCTSTVNVSMVDQNGRAYLVSNGGFVVLPGNSVTNFNVTNLPSGTYRVNFWVSGGNTATVAVELFDWWY